MSEEDNVTCYGMTCSELRTMARVHCNLTKAIVEDVVATIELELNNSTCTEYKCEDGTHISTDAGYVDEWFNDYKNKLREKYCK